LLPNSFTRRGYTSVRFATILPQVKQRIGINILNEESANVHVRFSTFMNTSDKIRL